MEDGDFGFESQENKWQDVWGCVQLLEENAGEVLGLGTEATKYVMINLVNHSGYQLRRSVTVNEVRLRSRIDDKGTDLFKMKHAFHPSAVRFLGNTIQRFFFFLCGENHWPWPWALVW